jgi:hypothetical protein
MLQNHQINFKVPEALLLVQHKGFPTVRAEVVIDPTKTMGDVPVGFAVVPQIPEGQAVGAMCDITLQACLLQLIRQIEICDNSTRFNPGLDRCAEVDSRLGMQRHSDVRAVRCWS